MTAFYIMMVLYTDGPIPSHGASAALTHVEFKTRRECEKSLESFRESGYVAKCFKIYRQFR